MNEWDDTTLQNRIWNMCPGGLRPSSLLVGHRGSPRYWLSGGEKHFASLKFEGQSGVRTRDLQLFKQAASTFQFCQWNIFIAILGFRNTMLYALHTHYPWALDLLIHVPFQLPFGAYSSAAISALRTNCTHCHLCPIRYSFTLQWSE